MKEIIRDKDLRIFGLVFSLILAVIAVRFLDRFKVTAGGWVLFCATVCFFLALLRPRILAPFHRILSSVAKIIGGVVSSMVLAVIFFAVFTPLAFYLRISRADILDLRIEKDRPSYWRQRKDRLLFKALFLLQFFCSWYIIEKA